MNNITYSISKLNEAGLMLKGVESSVKRIKQILTAQKALGEKRYTEIDLHQMSDQELKHILDRMESNIEKKGIKGYTPTHLT